MKPLLVWDPKTCQGSKCFTNPAELWGLQEVTSGRVRNKQEEAASSCYEGVTVAPQK